MQSQLEALKSNIKAAINIIEELRPDRRHVDEMKAIVAKHEVLNARIDDIKKVLEA